MDKTRSVLFFVLWFCLPLLQRASKQQEACVHGSIGLELTVALVVALLVRWTTVKYARVDSPSCVYVEEYFELFIVGDCRHLQQHA